MNILIVTDKQDSAIDKLAQMIEKYNQYLNIDVISVHPKRPDVQQLNTFEILAAKADLIDFHYWKAAEKLKPVSKPAKSKPEVKAKAPVAAKKEAPKPKADKPDTKKVNAVSVKKDVKPAVKEKAEAKKPVEERQEVAKA